jgi:hypothetical protein
MMKDIQDPERKENRAKIFEEIGELMDRYLKQLFLQLIPVVIERILLSEKIILS